MTLREVAPVGDDERELLLAAEQDALAVLSAANKEAARITREAEDDAVALLREQQESATNLLQRARDTATHEEGSSEHESEILEAHRAAAQMLGDAEKDVAKTLSKSKTNDAVDVLMAGHREASAILLAAWMQVTEGRPDDR